MKYFTPELYLRYNAADEAIADEADDAWERAVGQYKRYLAEHRNQMPPNVRALAEKCCFHDAVLLGWQTHEQGNGRKSKTPRMATVGLQQADETIVLCYFLSDEPKEKKSRKNWPFSSNQKHWLYDEVAVANHEFKFIHRILWSDGSELDLPFEDVIIDRFPSMSPAKA
jgi:hypothetical protein